MKKYLIATMLGFTLATSAFAQDSRIYARPVTPSRAALDKLHLNNAWKTHVPVEGKLDGIKSVQYYVALKLDGPGMEAARKADVPPDVLKRIKPMQDEYYASARSFLRDLMNYMIPEEIEKFGVILLKESLGKGDQLIVQTRAGLVAAIDPLTGRTIWRARVGVPYRVTYPVAVNSRSVFVLRGLELFALNRKTGDRRWDYRLPEQPSAAIAADEENIFVPAGLGKLYAYAMPLKHRKPGKKPSGVADYQPPPPAFGPAPARAYEERSGGYGTRGVGIADVASMKARAGHEPVHLFTHHTDARLETAPILSEDGVVLAGRDGTFFIASQEEKRITNKFQTGAPLAAPLGQHRLLLQDGQIIEMAYIASRDNNVYALDVVKGAIIWRFTGGAPILKQPAVTDKDVFIQAEGAGLYRVDRINGDTMWRNKQARRFLAANNHFVYAADRGGRLMVLDYATGKTRGLLDTSGFSVPVFNEWTDRLFLAGQNGLIVCLHDRNHRAPLRVKTLLEKKDKAQEVLKLKLEEEMKRKKKMMEEQP